MKIKRSYKIALAGFMLIKIAIFAILILGSCNRYVNTANSNKVVYHIKK
ncbi:MAG: hypothetical protein RBT38_11730 [Bacteroidales bacterium]|jgi:hypothetical protein|nr:hypothetical protein [Bacteroidales bacterium]